LCIGFDVFVIEP